jgi:hypothetical protein
MKGNVNFCLMLSPRNSLNNTIFFRCGYPFPHVLKVTNKLTIEMIKVQHWKLYASHYNDDDDTLGIGLELKKLQFKYSNYEGMGVPISTKILDSCRSNLYQKQFPYLYDMTRMEDYNSALAIERTGCCVTMMEYETATDIGINVSCSISFFS